MQKSSTASASSGEERQTMQAFLNNDRTRVMGPVEMEGRLAALEDALRERPHHIMQTKGGEITDDGPVFSFNIDGEMQAVLGKFVSLKSVELATALATALGNLLRRERYIVIGRFFLGLQGNRTPNEEDCVAEGRKNEGEQIYVLYHNFFAHQAAEGNLGYTFPAFFDNPEELRAKLTKVTDVTGFNMADVRQLARVVYVISRRGPDCLSFAQDSDLYHAILQAAEQGMMAGGFSRRRENWSWVYPRYPLLLHPMRFAVPLPTLPPGAAVAASARTLCIYAPSANNVAVLDMSGHTQERVVDVQNSPRRAQASACMIDGCVYITGGENVFDAREKLRQSWNTLYKVSTVDGTLQWLQGMDHEAQVHMEKMRPLPHLKHGGHYRHAHTSVVHEGSVYVISGFIWAKGMDNKPVEVLRSDVMRYDTRARTGWVCLPDTRKGQCMIDHRDDERAEGRPWYVQRAACAAVVVKDCAYIIGGYSQSGRVECSAAVLCLDLLTGAVSQVDVKAAEGMDLDRVGAGACAYGNSIYLVGGQVLQEEVPLKSAVRLDLSADGTCMTAVQLPDMPSPCAECHAMMLEPMGPSRPALVVLTPERACVMDTQVGVWGKAGGKGGDDHVFFHEEAEEAAEAA